MTHFKINADNSIQTIHATGELPEALSDAIRITQDNWPHTPVYDTDGTTILEYTKDVLLYHTWVADENYPDGGYVEEDSAKILEMDKLAQKEALKSNRDASIIAPFTTASGKTFDVAKPEDRENIEGALANFATLATLAGKTTITWTLADSSEAEVTEAELQEVVDGYVLRKAQAYAEYQAAKALL